MLAGLAVCIGLWRKRRDVVLSFSRYQDEFGTAQGNGKPVRSFWEGIPYLLDSAVNLQTTLKLQKNFMRTAVVRKLLFGEYTSGAEPSRQRKSRNFSAYSVLWQDFGINQESIQRLEPSSGTL